MKAKSKFVVLAAMLTCVTVPLASARSLAGVLVLPSDITIDATSSAGDSVTFSVGVNDPADTWSCDHTSGDTFQIGSTTVNCQAFDAGANQVDSGSFTVTVVDEPPTVVAPSDITLATEDPGGTVVTYPPAAVHDAVDGDSSVDCSPASGSTFAIGATTVTCAATDSGGHSGSATFTVTVNLVHNPPVITAPQDFSVPTTNSSGAVVTFTASAVDAADGPEPVTCDPASGSTFAVGTTTVNCTAQDSNGNVATASFHVTVQLDQPPVLSNVPADIHMEADSPQGTAVTFATPTATDDFDGPIAAVTCNPPSGTTFPIGTTSVTCSATDSSGNVGSASFAVRIDDTTPPALSLPTDQNLTATSYSGVAYSFTATATDAVDGSLPVSCTPGSGSTFGPGTTTVACKATDAHGNTSAGSFAVTVGVIDKPPVLSNVPAVIRREANSPQGSVVTFPMPTAIDDIDGPIATVTCTPASGTLFPIGRTTVTCQASDSHNHVASAAFTVGIVDTTPPVLYAPGDRTYVAPTSAGEPSSSFTRLASASDIADPNPVITANAPDISPIGTTVVTFTARDASGNQTSATSKMTVLPPGTTAPKTPAPDRTPPDDVTGVAAKAADGVVVVTWKPSKASDFAGVVITRGPANGSSAPQVVYRGSATSFTDRGVKNGVEYRYVVTAFDKSGNTSAGAVVVALPKAALLRAPRDGARLKNAPTFRWVAWTSATYYNFQLFFGTTKVLSAWPVRNSFTLNRSWKYEGHRYRLRRGLYRWFVWPGLGARVDVHYGDLLGSSSFLVVG